MFTPSYPVIGILGGMGPTAGSDLFNKIVANTIANKDQEHLPTLMASLPHEIIDRTRYLLKMEETNPGYGMASLAMWLEKAGVTHCAIPCNTAHALPIWTVMQEELKKNNSKIIFMHILEEVRKECEERFLANNKDKVRIGVLATNGTRQMGTYTHFFNNSRFEIVYPSDKRQEMCQQSIYNEEYGIKAFSSKIKEEPVNLLLECIQELKDQGVEAVILGCTELPLALPEASYLGVPCIDPVNIQARALIRATYPDKLKF